MTANEEDRVDGGNEDGVGGRNTADEAIAPNFSDDDHATCKAQIAHRAIWASGINKCQPTYCEGALRMELSGLPIPFHISTCFNHTIDANQGKSFAMLVCRIACMAADVLRGRRPVAALRRYVSAQCMKRLETVSDLVGNHLRNNQEMRKRFCFMPAVPLMLNGVLVNRSKLEVSMLLTIGREEYVVSLVLHQQGSRWLCVLADMG